MLSNNLITYLVLAGRGDIMMTLAKTSGGKWKHSIICLLHLQHGKHLDTGNSSQFLYSDDYKWYQTQSLSINTACIKVTWSCNLRDPWKGSQLGSSTKRRFLHSFIVSKEESQGQDIWQPHLFIHSSTQCHSIHICNAVERRLWFWKWCIGVWCCLNFLQEKIPLLHIDALYNHFRNFGLVVYWGYYMRLSDWYVSAFWTLRV